MVEENDQEYIQVIKVFVGYDSREAIAYHVFCQSIIENSKQPVSFIPLSLDMLSQYTEQHTDGSNDFIYSRFLVPYLCDFDGWAIFADGDMICLDDIGELYKLRDDKFAVMVVKHDYITKAKSKYLGNKNENYPRKNWSSVILWNCNHEKNKVLTPELVSQKPGSYLHRFSWLDDELIGELPSSWNWLAIEYPDNNEANIIHYTLGTPCFKDYSETSHSDLWYKYYSRLNSGIEE